MTSLDYAKIFSFDIANLRWIFPGTGGKLNDIDNGPKSGFIMPLTSD
jgi:hypothetical protein